MRIRVTDILDLIASGLTVKNVLTEMPDLEEEDIRQALAYASSKIDHPILKVADAVARCATVAFGGNCMSQTSLASIAFL